MPTESFRPRGYKSIDPQGQVVKFGDITILLGANGSGKSNLVSFFKLLNFITSKGLQIFIGKQGGTNSLLYYGSKHTEKIEFIVTLQQSGETSTMTGDSSLPPTITLPEATLHFPPEI